MARGTAGEIGEGDQKIEVSLSMQSLETTAANMLLMLGRIQATLAAYFANAGSTPFKLESAATTNATSVTATTTILRDLNIVNTTGVVYYLKLYNKATAPTVGTDIPVATFACYATSTTAPVLPAGIKFTLGLGLALTALNTNADATVAALGLQINIGYN